MKIKIDFITNSSSASFMIPKSCLNEKQIHMIINHIELGVLMGERTNLRVYTDPWKIDINEHSVEGYTSMDNFPMSWFLDDIVRVDKECIHWEGSNY